MDFEEIKLSSTQNLFLATRCMISAIQWNAEVVFGYFICRESEELHSELSCWRVSQNMQFYFFWSLNINIAVHLMLYMIDSGKLFNVLVKIHLIIKWFQFISFNSSYLLTLKINGMHDTFRSQKYRQVRL